MMNEEPAEEIKPRRKSYFYYFKAVGIVFLVIFAYIWFLVPPRQIDRPIRLEKDKNGNLSLIGQEDSKDPVSLQAGKLNAKNNRFSGTSSSKSNVAYFFSRSLIVMNFSKHPLMERIGFDVIEQLKEESSYDRVDYFPSGHFPEPGQPAPDHYLTLDLESIEESGILASKLKAKFAITFGTSLIQSYSSTQDNLTPPILRFRSNIQLEHESQLQGLESSAAKYKMQSENIAKEITKEIFNKIEDYESDEDLVVGQKIGRDFYPEYTPIPEFNFLKNFNAQRLTSTHGIMSHNETYWKIENVNDPKTLLSAIHEELLKEKIWRSDGPFNKPDWDKGDQKTIERLAWNVRLKKGKSNSKVLKIFRSKANMQEEDDGVYYVRYQHRMTTDELKDVFETLLSKKNPNYGFLLSMRRYAHHTQREKIIKAIEANPPQTRDAWVALAEHYSWKKNKEATFEALQKLYHINFASTDANRDDSTIKRIAKKLKLDDKEIKKLDFEMLKKLGFTELTSESDAKRIKFQVGTSAKFLLIEPEKEWKVVSIEIDSHKVVDGTPTYKMKFIESQQNHGRSWMTSSGNRFQHPRTQSSTFNGKRFKFQIEKIDDQTFQATGEFQPSPKKKPDTKTKTKQPIEV